MRIALINAGLPDGVSSCLRSRAYPPLSVIYLGTHLRYARPGVEVAVVDDQLDDRIDPDYVAACDLIGISANSISYPRAIQLARRVRALRPDVPIVLGGIHATLRPRQIVANRSCFDHVVVGPGEEAILALLDGDPEQGLRIIGPSATVAGNPGPQSLGGGSLMAPDFSLVPFERYEAFFGRRYSRKAAHRPAAFLSSTGCEWRNRTGGCSFCAIPKTAHRKLPPGGFWQVVSTINESTGATFLWDVSDTFSSDRSWLEAVAKGRPDWLKPRFHVYVRASDIRDASAARCLRRIGVDEALVGAESFDNRILKRCGKGATAEQTIRCVDLLTDVGIGLSLSLVFGLPGEDQASLGQTMGACERFQTREQISEIHASIITPLPGSRIFDDLISQVPSLAHVDGLDVLPHDELVAAYVPEFTECTVDQLVDAFLAVDNMFPSAGPFYMRKDSSEYGSIGYTGSI